MTTALDRTITTPDQAPTRTPRRSPRPTRSKGALATAVLAVSAIVGLLYAVDVGFGPSPDDDQPATGSPPADGSFDQAEANRQARLVVQADNSFDQAEANRQARLVVQADNSFDSFDSFDQAEADRHARQAPSADDSFNRAERRRMLALES